MKYVKRNALADQAFESFGAPEQHLAEWITIADQRCHGTTREAPVVRFERDERAALPALPIRALPRRGQRLRRRVAHYAGLWRSALDDRQVQGLAVLGRDLADYAAVVEGGQ